MAILGHASRPGVRQVAARLQASLKRRGCEVRLERGLAARMGLAGESLEPLARWCQLLITLGGDGTMLVGARALAGRRGVLLPINLGGLGFLTVAEVSELDMAFGEVMAGRWKVVPRPLVQVRLKRGRRAVASAIAVNDAVVRGPDGVSAVHLHIEALGRSLGHLVADGLIVATAAGSTAYSLSAGGPVLGPDVEALVITPVAPHSLGTRPLVLSARARLSLEVLGPERAMLVLDGQEIIELRRRDVIELATARAQVRVFLNPRRPFLRSLQAKLGWQGSKKRSL